MIWRRWERYDEKAVLDLLCEPMQGKISLRWGLTGLDCPPECDHLRGYAIEVEGKVTGCAATWDWPNGSRYLNGLRFGRHMSARPTPSFWRESFRSMLEGTDCAWTSIGTENEPARRILESNLRCLPYYRERQRMVTSFVPLSRRQRLGKNCDLLDLELRLVPANWRYVSIASGRGYLYTIGRILNEIGQPGIPAPESRIRIAYFHPTEKDNAKSMRQVWREARGYDGLVVTLPRDSEMATYWAEVAPRTSWDWNSILYSVSWNRELDVSVPSWKGAWL